MIAVTLINLLSVLLTYLYSKNIFKRGFDVAILILIVFFGIRYNYGNDYPSYLKIFIDINRYQDLELSTESTGIELGWKILNRLFSSIGFFSMVFALTAFQFVSIYWLIKRYVYRRYRYAALFVYLFSFGYMLTMLSMMRQALAMNIILWAIPSILSGKYIKSLLIIVLASQFHQSAYLMLVLPFTIYLNNNVNKNVYRIIMVSLFVGAFLSQSMLSTMMQAIVSDNFEKYNYYMSNEGVKINGGLGFIFNILFFLVLVLGDKQSNKKWWLTKCLALSYVFLPFSFVLQLVGRIGMYWQLIGLPGIFNLYECYERKIGFKVLMVAFFFIMLYGYFTSCYDDLWRKGFMEYHTIFEASNWM